MAAEHLSNNCINVAALVRHGAREVTAVPAYASR